MNTGLSGERILRSRGHEADARKSVILNGRKGGKRDGKKNTCDRLRPFCRCVLKSLPGSGQGPSGEDRRCTDPERRTAGPVRGRSGKERLLALIQETEPDAVLCTGLAAGRKALTPEVIAVNLKNARIPDNKGQQPLWEKIREDGPDGIFARADVRRMASSMLEAGIPAEVSFSAGTFVCNEVMYRLLETDLPGGFVHVPCAAELPRREENFALPMKEIARGLEICILELSKDLT